MTCENEKCKAAADAFEKYLEQVQELNSNLADFLADLQADIPTDISEAAYDAARFKYSEQDMRKLAGAEAENLSQSNADEILGKNTLTRISRTRGADTEADIPEYKQVNSVVASIDAAAKRIAGNTHLAKKSCKDRK